MLSSLPCAVLESCLTKVAADCGIVVLVPVGDGGVVGVGHSVPAARPC